MHEGLALPAAIVLVEKGDMRSREHTLRVEKLGM
jgi:hypothetical protein